MCRAPIHRFAFHLAVRLTIDSKSITFDVFPPEARWQEEFQDGSFRDSLRITVRPALLSHPSRWDM